MAGKRLRLGEVVERLRNQRGLSQNELGRRAGLSTGYVSQLESGTRGKRPSRDSVLRLAQGLQASKAETAELLRAAGLLGAGEQVDVPGRPPFEVFVNGEPLLRREQKEMLLRLYRSYVPSR